MHFEANIDVPLDIVDIHIVGSNASYNWTDKSDLDVHIIANYNVVDSNTELVKSIYDLKKSIFNKEHDITLHGVNVEVYVEDIKSNTVSNGIYSVCDNDWVKEPKLITSAKKHNTEKEVEKWSQRIADTLSRNKYSEINDLLNSLYLMRKNSLAVDGEYGKGNQIFKELRYSGALDNLKLALKHAVSKQLSLEEYRGKFVNQYED